MQIKKYFIFILLTCLFCKGQAQDKKAKLPNIILLVSEDNSPFLGCYGDTYANTPNLDRFATEGILFEQAFSNAPVCAPSRSTLITGLYATSMGTENMRSQYSVPDFIKLFPEYLRKAGYYTVNKSKTDYNLSPLENRLEDTWDDSSIKATYKNRKPGQPFFAMYNSSITHEVSIHTPKDPLKHDPNNAPIPPYHPSTPEIQHDWAQYYDRVTLMDKWVGGILNDLEKDGLAENTIVFYFSDHGGILGRSKRFLYESGLHVPLIVRIPQSMQSNSQEKAGTRIKKTVSFIDFAPTILHLAGVPVPKYMQGSILLGHKTDDSDKPVFGFRGRMDETIDLSRTVRKGKYRYIRNYMPHKIYGQYIEYLWRAPSMKSWENEYKENHLDSVKSAFWKAKPYEELYDCEADPHNVQNLANSKTYSSTLKELSITLDKWIINTHDLGFVPEPMIAEINKTMSLYEWAQKDKYPLPRILETASIAASRDIDCLPFLRERLKDKNPIVRYWAATGCRILETEAINAKPLLMEIAKKDNDASVRAVAAESLYYLGNKKLAIQLLSQALLDNNLMLRVQALNTLQQFGQDAQPALTFVRKMIDKDPEGKGYDIAAAKELIRTLNK